MSTPTAILLALCLAMPALAQNADITCAAQITTAPEAVPETINNLVDGRIGTALNFEVGTEGNGQITFGFDIEREVSAVRMYQSSDIYFSNAYLISADRNGDDRFETIIAEGKEFPIGNWVEHTFAEPVRVRAIRFLSTDGISKGRRAHPVLAEFQIIGKPLPGDVQAANEKGIRVSQLTTPRAIYRDTPLVVEGRQPALIAPDDPAYAPAVGALIAGLQAAGISPEQVATIEQADPAHRTVICIGSMLNNVLIERLYWNRYTFIDALVPGPGNYIVQTVCDPYPYSGGMNVVVLGCSDPAGAEPAVARLLELLGDGRLPYTVVGGPQPLVPEPTAARVTATEPNPTLTELTDNVNGYLSTGCDAYAEKAVRAMRTVAALYAPGAERSATGTAAGRKLPWPEETSSWEIQCAWDAFDECPLIDEQLRLEFTNAMLAFTRELLNHVSGYGAVGANDTVSWNHTTFPLLGMHFGARYFKRYYGLVDMDEYLQKAEACFTAQSRSWKPQEDADSYLTLTTAHSQVYSLAENDMRYFEAGNMEKYADYMVGICDNLGLASGFGDSGISSNPNLPQLVLPLGLWHSGDGGYKWLLAHYTNGTWQNPYERGIEPVRPDRFTGVNVFMTDPQVYDYIQSGPTYNEPFARADVPIEESFDKISFRENWEAGGQYLLLDGIARGKHLHYDGNSIIEFVEGQERWLLDHDYLTRNSTEHTMLTVLRNGRADALVPSLAGLTAYANLPGLGYTQTYCRDYNSCDWTRKVLWRRGEWFLVSDTVTPREPDHYDLELTWKTIDEAGAQRVEGQSFVAERGTGTAATADCLHVDDPDASGGRALMMGIPNSRICFGVDLPAGEYSLTIVAFGLDGSSDSLWASIDNGDRVAFHIPQGQYGPSASDHTKTTNTPKVVLEGKGPHLVTVTLRELPPVRVDRFIFGAADGSSHVFEAEDLPPAPRPAEDQGRYFHIKPARPLNAAWVTNHTRAGIVVPVSVLHQRLSGEMIPGASARFASLMYVSRAGKRRDFTPAELAPNLIAISGAEPTVAVLGDLEGDTDAAGLAPGALVVRCESGLLTGRSMMFSGLRRMELLDASMTATPAIDIEVNLATGTADVIAPEGGAQLRVRAGTQPRAIHLPAGRSSLQIPEFADLPHVAKYVDNVVSAAWPVSDGVPAVDDGAEQPVWSAFEPDARLWRMKTADLGDGNGERLFVCRGPYVSCLNPDGTEAWRFQAQGQVRDVAFGDLRDEPGLEVLVGSADAHLYLLSADGHLLDSHQPTGIPWARSFGERAWGVFNVLVEDITGDGTPEILATLQNFDLQALTADWQLLWRRDHALHGSIDMSLEDIDGDGVADTIFLGDKYGSSAGVDFSGKKTYQRYTSIGDVVYTVTDMNGDGKKEVVTASSTGDMVATPVDAQNTTLWRFDNFGYPANRLVAVNLDGKPGDEVLVASGTGYVYALNAAGEVLWQDRPGVCVHDVIAVQTPAGLRVVYCDESGLVRVADAAGHAIAEVRTPGVPVRLSTINDGTVAVGLADGRVMAYSLLR